MSMSPLYLSSACRLLAPCRVFLVLVLVTQYIAVVVGFWLLYVCSIWKSTQGKRDPPAGFGNSSTIPYDALSLEVLSLESVSAWWVAHFGRVP